MSSPISTVVVCLFLFLVLTNTAFGQEEGKENNRQEQEEDSNHHHAGKIRSIETACQQEVSSMCRHASSTVGGIMGCLSDAPRSNIRRVCASWLEAFQSCELGMRLRGTPCDLERHTMQHCLRDVAPHDLPAGCSGHDVFHHAKAMRPVGAQRKRYQF